MKNISRVDINVALFTIITEKVMATRSAAESLGLIVRKLERSVKRAFLYAKSVFVCLHARIVVRNVRTVRFFCP